MSLENRKLFFLLGLTLTSFLFGNGILHFYHILMFLSSTSMGWLAGHQDLCEIDFLLFLLLSECFETVCADRRSYFSGIFFYLYSWKGEASDLFIPTTVIFTFCEFRRERKRMFSTRSRFKNNITKLWYSWKTLSKIFKIFWSAAFHEKV